MRATHIADYTYKISPMYEFNIPKMRAAKPLAAGWQAVTDKNSGREYYFEVLLQGYRHCGLNDFGAGNVRHDDVGPAGGTSRDE